MTKPSALRIALGADSVSIWSSEIFGAAEPSKLRDFLSRAFAVQEVDGVELRRATAFGRVRYGAVAHPARIWKQLSRALTSPEGAASASGLPDTAARRIDAGLVYLDGPGSRPVRVSRIGNVLSTWRVRHQGDGTLRLSHPVLRQRRDVVFRLEEELAALLGVEDFQVSALTAGVSIRFDARTTTAERLARELEKAWPRLLEGLDGPPSKTRLVAAVGLMGLAFTGQYLAPVVRPIAVAGVTLYSLPNVVNAGKQLSHGQVGISALYSAGLLFMLVTGMPFTASVMATLMQAWPHLARRKLVQSQRRLFAGQRRRPAWARQLAAGVEVEVHVDELRKGDRIVVRRGEIIPVDGVVENGSATVIDDAPFAADQIEDRSPGDSVAAGALLQAGNLTIRVERAGAQTSASYLDSLLPHTAFVGLPSSYEAERIANRNAKPVLALSALNLLLTRTLPPSQALLRPDYATAPRLSAQLSALQGVAEGLQRGIWFRNPAALDRLANADVVVIDDTAELDRQGVEVAAVQTVDGVSTDVVLGYTLAAQGTSRSEQSRALSAFASKRNSAQPRLEAIRRDAGVTRYRDSLGSEIDIVSSSYVATSQLDVPERLQSTLARRTEARAQRVESAPANDPPALRSLWVLRDGAIIGVVAFARTGEFVARQSLAALRAQNKRARIVYVSSGGQAEAQGLAQRLGLDFSQGGLSAAAKADLIRGWGRAALWLGDGSDPNASKPIAASAVSVSLAPLSHAREDAADILLPHTGLSGLAEAIELGRAHAQRLKKDYRAVYLANLLGATGAFVPGLTPLQVGLLSNVGTGFIYARHARRLDELVSAAEQKRARLTSPAGR
jgi:manganese/zinc-transporting P-type ATPase C